MQIPHLLRPATLGVCRPFDCARPRARGRQVLSRLALSRSTKPFFRGTQWVYTSFDGDIRNHLQAPFFIDRPICCFAIIKRLYYCCIVIILHVCHGGLMIIKRPHFCRLIIGSDPYLCLFPRQFSPMSDVSRSVICPPAEDPS